MFTGRARPVPASDPASDDPSAVPERPWLAGPDQPPPPTTSLGVRIAGLGLLTVIAMLVVGFAIALATRQ